MPWVLMSSVWQVFMLTVLSFPVPSLAVTCAFALGSAAVRTSFSQF